MNGIAVHAWNMEHRPDWDATEILETEPHYWRRILEAIWIQKTPLMCNLDCGNEVLNFHFYYQLSYVVIQYHYLRVPVYLLLLRKVPETETSKFYDKVCYAKLNNSNLFKYTHSNEPLQYKLLLLYYSADSSLQAVRSFKMFANVSSKLCQNWQIVDL